MAGAAQGALGVGTALAVIINATVVGALLLPFLMALARDRGWWRRTGCENLRMRLRLDRLEGAAAAPGAGVGPGRTETEPPRSRRHEMLFHQFTFRLAVRARHKAEIAAAVTSRPPSSVMDSTLKHYRTRKRTPSAYGFAGTGGRPRRPAQHVQHYPSTARAPRPEGPARRSLVPWPRGDSRLRQAARASVGQDRTKSSPTLITKSPAHIRVPNSTTVSASMSGRSAAKWAPQARHIGSKSGPLSFKIPIGCSSTAAATRPGLVRSASR